MNYYEKFSAQNEKLTNILDEHHLLHTFKTNAYPMTLTVQVNQAPGEQMALYEDSDEGVSSRDAKLVLTFPVGEIGVRVYGRLIIPETLMNKIKNCGKKMRDLYLQGEFATRMENKARTLARAGHPVEEPEEDSEEDMTFEETLGDSEPEEEAEE